MNSIKILHLKPKYADLTDSFIAGINKYYLYRKIANFGTISTLLGKFVGYYKYRTSVPK